MSRKALIWISFVIVMLMMAGCSLLPVAKPVTNSSVIGNLPVKDSLLEKHIPTQVLIKTQDEATLSQIVKDFHGEITGVIERLHTYKVNIDVNLKGSLVETIKTIGTYKKVEYVGPVYIYEATGIMDSEFASRQWGPDSIGIEEALNIAGNQGEGVVIAIADTGVDYTHPEFDTRVLPGYDAMTGMTGLEEARDYYGHGTHVAGIAAANLNSGKIVGIAPQSTILPVKVLDDSGRGSAFTIAAGISWAVDHGADVINLSLGGKGYSQAMQDAVDYAVSRNVPVVVAMANSGKNEVTYPAGCSGVIAVGATDGQRRVATFSTRGRHISVAAPGVDIYSAIPDGQYATMNGTSMATPHVAGAIALLLGEEPNLTVSEIKSRLEATAVDVDASGFDENTGYGVINLVSMLTTSVSDAYGVLKVFVEISGFPMPGVDVLVQDADGVTVKNIRTNENGIAIISNLAEGTYSVRAQVVDKQFSQVVNVVPGNMAVVNFVETRPTSLGGYVVDSRGGAGVVNSEITAIEEISGTTYSTVTNQDGSFFMELSAGIYSVSASKPGFAGSSYQRVHVNEGRLTTLNLIQRPVFSPVYSTVPPVIELTGLEENAVLGDLITFTVNVQGANAIKEISIRFGQFDEPDVTAYDVNMLEVTLDATYKPNGANVINIIVYDVNHNVAEWTVPIVINHENQGDPIPEQPVPANIVAMTFGESLGLFRAERQAIFEKLNRKENPYVLQVNGQEYDIQSAPYNATIYVTFYWNGVAYADGYKVYRSTSPFGPFALIADVDQERYTDCDPALTPELSFYYKVAAYNATGIGPKSEVIETKPMEPFRVWLQSPENYTSNVSINPKLTWSHTPIEADTFMFWLYVMGTTDADYTRMIEIYEEATSYQYGGGSLIPGKEYEWDIYTACVSRTYSSNSTAVSWSKQGNGSTNGAYIFTTDPNALPPVKESVMEMDIEDLDGFEEIVLEVQEEAFYEIATSYYSQDSDTILILNDEFGNQIGYNDDFDGYYSNISQTLTPGVYYIQVLGYNGAPVYCHLSVSKVVY